MFVVSRFIPKETFHPVCHTTGISKGPEILRLFPSTCHSRFARSLLSVLFRDIVPRVALIRSPKLSYHVSHKWKSYVLRRPFTISYALRSITWAGKLSHHVANKIFPQRKIRVIVDSFSPDHVRCKGTPFVALCIRLGVDGSRN